MNIINLMLEYFRKRFLRSGFIAIQPLVLIVLVLAVALVTFQVVKGPSQDIRERASGGCNIVDTPDGPGCWCSNVGWQFHCGVPNGQVAPAACRADCDARSNGSSNAPPNSAPKTGCVPHSGPNCGGDNQGYCTRCPQGNGGPSEYFCKSPNLASGGGCVAPQAGSSGAPPDAGTSTCNPTSYSCTSKSLAGSFKCGGKNCCPNGQVVSDVSGGTSAYCVASSLASTPTTSPNPSNNTQTASTAAQSALKNARCDANFGLCQAIDPKTGVVTGWVPSEKPVFCDATCALAARLNVIVGTGFHPVEIGGQTYNAYDWTGGTQSDSLNNLNSNQVAAIKKAADANKVTIDNNNFANPNLTPAQTAELNKKVQDFSDSQGKIQQVITDDLNQKLPHLLQKCSGCDVNTLNAFLQTNYPYFKDLTLDNQTRAISSAQKLMQDQTMSQTHIQNCLDVLTSGGSCDASSVPGITHDEVVVAQNSQKQLTQAKDLAQKYLAGENLTSADIDKIKAYYNISELDKTRSENKINQAFASIVSQSNTALGKIIQQDNEFGLNSQEIAALNQKLTQFNSLQSKFNACSQNCDSLAQQFKTYGFSDKDVKNLLANKQVQIDQGKAQTVFNFSQFITQNQTKDTYAQETHLSGLLQNLNPGQQKIYETLTNQSHIVNLLTSPQAKAEEIVNFCRTNVASCNSEYLALSPSSTKDIYTARKFLANQILDPKIREQLTNTNQALQNSKFYEIQSESVDFAQNQAKIVVDTGFAGELRSQCLGSKLHQESTGASFGGSGATSTTATHDTLCDLGCYAGACRTTPTTAQQQILNQSATVIQRQGEQISNTTTLDILKFAMSICSSRVPDTQLQSCVSSQPLSEWQSYKYMVQPDQALAIIFNPYTNLFPDPASKQQLEQQIIAGKTKPSDLITKVDQAQTTGVGWLAVNLNTISGGKVLVGNRILNSGIAEWNQGQKLKGAWDVTRGAWIQGFVPAQIAVIVAAPFAAGGLALVPGSLIGQGFTDAALVTTTNLINTTVSVNFAVNSVAHTSEVCPLNGTTNAWQCGLSLANTALSVAFINASALSGNAQISQTLGTKLSQTAAALATAGQTEQAVIAEQRAITYQANAILAANQAASGITRIGAPLVFGVNAIDACLIHNTDMGNCAVSVGMLGLTGREIFSKMASPNIASAFKFANVGLNTAVLATGCGAFLSGQSDVTGCLNAAGFAFGAYTEAFTPEKTATGLASSEDVTQIRLPQEIRADIEALRAVDPESAHLKVLEQQYQAAVTYAGVLLAQEQMLLKTSPLGNLSFWGIGDRVASLVSLRFAQDLANFNLAKTNFISVTSSTLTSDAYFENLTDVQIAKTALEAKYGSAKSALNFISNALANLEKQLPIAANNLKVAQENAERLKAVLEQVSPEGKATVKDNAERLNAVLEQVSPEGKATVLEKVAAILEEQQNLYDRLKSQTQELKSLQTIAQQRQDNTFTSRLAAFFHTAISLNPTQPTETIEHFVNRFSGQNLFVAVTNEAREAIARDIPITLEGQRPTFTRDQIVAVYENTANGPNIVGYFKVIEQGNEIRLAQAGTIIEGTPVVRNSLPFLETGKNLLALVAPTPLSSLMNSISLSPTTDLFTQILHLPEKPLLPGTSIGNTVSLAEQLFNQALAETKGPDPCAPIIGNRFPELSALNSGNRWGALIKFRESLESFGIVGKVYAAESENNPCGFNPFKALITIFKPKTESAFSPENTVRKHADIVLVLNQAAGGQIALIQPSSGSSANINFVVSPEAILTLNQQLSVLQAQGLVQVIRPIQPDGLNTINNARPPYSYTDFGQVLIKGPNSDPAENLHFNFVVEHKINGKLVAGIDNQSQPVTPAVPFAKAPTKTNLALTTSGGDTFSLTVFTPDTATAVYEKIQGGLTNSDPKLFIEAARALVDSSISVLTSRFNFGKLGQLASAIFSNRSLTPLVPLLPPETQTQTKLEGTGGGGEQIINQTTVAVRPGSQIPGTNIQVISADNISAVVRLNNQNFTVPLSQPTIVGNNQITFTGIDPTNVNRASFDIAPSNQLSGIFQSQYGQKIHQALNIPYITTEKTQLEINQYTHAAEVAYPKKRKAYILKNPPEISVINSKLKLEKQKNKSDSHPLYSHLTALFTLYRSGIWQAGKIIEYFEAYHGNTYSFQYQELTSPDMIKLFKQYPNLGQGLTRYQELQEYLQFNLFDTAYPDEVYELLNRLGKAPERNYRQVKAQLNKYISLHIGTFINNVATNEFRTYVEIIERGKLSSEQQNALETLDQIVVLASGIDNFKPNSYPLHISSYLNEITSLSNIQRMNISYRTLSYLYGKFGPKPYADIFASLPDIKDIEELYSFISAGWEITNEMEIFNIKQITSSRENQSALLNYGLWRSLSIKFGLPLTIAYDDFSQLNILLPHLPSFLIDFIGLPADTQQKLTDVYQIVDTYFNLEQYGIHQPAASAIRNNFNNRGIHNILQPLLQSLINNPISKSEVESLIQIFGQYDLLSPEILAQENIRQILDPHKEDFYLEALSVLPAGNMRQFLASHKDRFLELFHGSIPTSQFIYEYYTENAGSSIYQSANTWSALEPFVTKEFLSSLSTTDRQYWQTVKNTSSQKLRTFLLSNYNDRAQYFQNETVTSKFILELARHVTSGNFLFSTADVNLIHSFLTDQFLESLPDQQERKLWEIIRNPEAFMSFSLLIKDQDKDKRYFHDGQFQEDFFNELAMMAAIDKFASDSRYTELETIFTDDLLAHLSPDSQAYFKLIRQSKNYDLLKFLTNHHSTFSTRYMANGLVDIHALLVDLAQLDTNYQIGISRLILQPSFIQSFPINSPQRKFYEYLSTQSPGMKQFYLRHYPEFSDLVINGIPTPRILDYIKYYPGEDVSLWAGMATLPQKFYEQIQPPSLSKYWSEIIHSESAAVRDSLLYFINDSGKIATIYSGKQSTALELVRAIIEGVNATGKLLSLDSLVPGYIDSNLLKDVVDPNEKLFWQEIYIRSQLARILINLPTSFTAFNIDMNVFDQIQKGGSSTSLAHSEYIGSLILPKLGKAIFPETLVDALIVPQIDSISEMVRHGKTESLQNITQDNWLGLLHAAIISNDPNIIFQYRLTPEAATFVRELFNDPKAKDFVYEQTLNLWKSYLESGDPQKIPLELMATSLFVNKIGNAGTLSQLEALAKFTASVASAIEKSPDEHRLHIINGLQAIENRFTNEKWSRESQTDFYNISQDFIDASPALFTDFLSLFDNLNANEFQRFITDIYPLYRIKLALQKNDLSNSTLPVVYPDIIAAIQVDLANFHQKFREPQAYDTQKIILLKDIRSLFQSKFGITQIPSDFRPDQIRSITNISTYLTNIHKSQQEENQKNEAILGYYLALLINNHWNEFRRGVAFDPKDYLTPEKASLISNLVSSHQSQSPIQASVLGIQDKDLPQFIELLQKDASITKLEDIETIDVKLNNIVLNLGGLEDLDLYSNTLDRERMRILTTYDRKIVGRTIAKFYQSLNNPKRSTDFLEEEKPIIEDIKRILSEQNIPLSTSSLKEYFQDGLKPFTTIISVLDVLGTTQAKDEIEKLRTLLQPSNEVINLFNKLGENFQPSSGAIAVAQDLNYLQKFIVDHESELSPEEIQILQTYVDNIRQQFIKLTDIYERIKDRFNQLKNAKIAQENSLLETKISQIEAIINSHSTTQIVTSTLTTQPNVIIENMRECLACVRQGANNDTNLSLMGDMNKFYLYSYTDSQQSRGSISDQIVYFVPTPNGMAFVLDLLYGTRTPALLINQIAAVVSKYRSIKDKFPQTKISILISYPTMSSAGMSKDLLIEKLRSEFGTKATITSVDNVEVTVAASPFSDHYIEFGGGTRSSGPRKVSGVELEVPTHTLELNTEDNNSVSAEQNPCEVENLGSLLPEQKTTLADGFLVNEMDTDGSEFPRVTEQAYFISQILGSGNSETPYRGVINPLASTFVGDGLSTNMLSPTDSSATLISTYQSKSLSANLSRVLSNLLIPKAYAAGGLPNPCTFPKWIQYKTQQAEKLIDKKWNQLPITTRQAITRTLLGPVSPLLLITPNQSPNPINQSQNVFKQARQFWQDTLVKSGILDVDSQDPTKTYLSWEKAIDNKHPVLGRLPVEIKDGTSRSFTFDGKGYNLRPIDFPDLQDLQVGQEITYTFYEKEMAVKKTANGISIRATGKRTPLDLPKDFVNPNPPTSGPNGASNGFTTNRNLYQYRAFLFKKDNGQRPFIHFAPVDLGPVGYIEKAQDRGDGLLQKNLEHPTMLPSNLYGGENNFFAPRKVILDDGAGEGIAAAQFAKAYPQSIIIGADTGYTKHTNLPDLTHTGVQFVKSNWDDLSEFPNSSVDRIMSVQGAFYHSENLQKTALAATRVAKEGALIRINIKSRVSNITGIVDILLQLGWEVYEGPDVVIAQLVQKPDLTSLISESSAIDKITNTISHTPQDADTAYLTSPSNKEYLLDQFEALLETRNKTNPSKPIDIFKVIENLRDDLFLEGNTIQVWQKHIEPYTSLSNFIGLSQGGTKTPFSSSPTQSEVINFNTLRKYDPNLPSTFDTLSPTLLDRVYFLTNKLFGKDIFLLQPLREKFAAQAQKTSYIAWATQTYGAEKAKAYLDRAQKAIALKQDDGSPEAIDKSLIDVITKGIQSTYHTQPPVGIFNERMIPTQQDSLIATAIIALAFSEDLNLQAQFAEVDPGVLRSAINTTKQLSAQVYQENIHQARMTLAEGQETALEDMPYTSRNPIFIRNMTSLGIFADYTTYINGLKILKNNPQQLIPILAHEQWHFLRSESAKAQTDFNLFQYIYSALRSYDLVANIEEAFAVIHQIEVESKITGDPIFGKTPTEVLLDPNLQPQSSNMASEYLKATTVLQIQIYQELVRRVGDQEANRIFNLAKLGFHKELFTTVGLSFIQKAFTGIQVYSPASDFLSPATQNPPPQPAQSQVNPSQPYSGGITLTAMNPIISLGLVAGFPYILRDVILPTAITVNNWWYTHVQPQPEHISRPYSDQTLRFANNLVKAYEDVLSLKIGDILINSARSVSDNVARLESRVMRKFPNNYDQLRIVTVPLYRLTGNIILIGQQINTTVNTINIKFIQLFVPALDINNHVVVYPKSDHLINQVLPQKELRKQFIIEEKLFGQYVGEGTFARSYRNGDTLIKLFRNNETEQYLVDTDTDAEAKRQLEFYKQYGGHAGGLIQEFKGEITSETGHVIGFKQAFVKNSVTLKRFINFNGHLTQKVVDDFINKLSQFYSETGLVHGDLTNYEVQGRNFLNQDNILVVLNQDGTLSLTAIDWHSVHTTQTPTEELFNVKEGFATALEETKSKSNDPKTLRRVYEKSIFPQVLDTILSRKTDASQLPPQLQESVKIEEISFEELEQVGRDIFGDVVNPFSKIIVSKFAYRIVKFTYQGKELYVPIDESAKPYEKPLLDTLSAAFKTHTAFAKPYWSGHHLLGIRVNKNTNVNYYLQINYDENISFSQRALTDLTSGNIFAVQAGILHEFTHEILLISGETENVDSNQHREVYPLLVGFLFDPEARKYLYYGLSRREPIPYTIHDTPKKYYEDWSKVQKLLENISGVSGFENVWNYYHNLSEGVKIRVLTDVFNQVYASGENGLNVENIQVDHIRTLLQKQTTPPSSEQSAVDQPTNPIEVAAEKFIKDLTDGCEVSDLQRQTTHLYADRINDSGKDLLFGGAFGTGESENEYNQSKQQQNRSRKQISDSKSIHISSPVFLDNATLTNQSPAVITTPKNTINQSGLSNELVMTGESTIMPKETWPALSNIFDNRSNWPEVKTGSFAKYITPDNLFIDTDHNKVNDTGSTGFSLIPSAYAEERPVQPKTGCNFIIKTILQVLPRQLKPKFRQFLKTTDWQQPVVTLLRKIGIVDKQGHWLDNKLLLNTESVHPAENLISTGSKLTSDQRENFKKSATKVIGDVAYFLPDGTVYREKSGDHLRFYTEKNVLQQIEIFQLLSKLGIFPKETQWFYFETTSTNQQAFQISSLMPQLDQTQLSQLPQNDMNNSEMIRRIEEKIRSISPNIDFTKNESGLYNSKEANLWFSVLFDFDAFPARNWAYDKHNTLYLIDPEGINVFGSFWGSGSSLEEIKKYLEQLILKTNYSLIKTQAQKLGFSQKNEDQKPPEKPEEEINPQPNAEQLRKYRVGLTGLIVSLLLTADSRCIQNPPDPFLMHEVVDASVPILTILYKLNVAQYPPSGITVTNNPNYRPYNEILTEGIQKFKDTHPNTPVFWKKDPNSLNTYEYDQLMQQPITTAECISFQFYQDICQKYVGKSLPEEVLSSADIKKYINTDQMSNPITPEMSMFIGIFISRMPNIIQKALFVSGGIGTFRHPVDDDFFNQLNTFVENKVAAKNQPISVSEILPLILEHHHGDLSSSLIDQSDFLEYSSRLSSRKDPIDMINWTKNNIRDEYSVDIPYQDLPLIEQLYPKNNYIYYDFSLPNRVGEPYHAANIVALLSYLPPEAISFLVTGEYLQYGKRQGLGKALADFVILRDLQTIQNTLTQYDPSGTIIIPQCLNKPLPTASPN